MGAELWKNLHLWLMISDSPSLQLLLVFLLNYCWIFLLTCLNAQLERLIVTFSIFPSFNFLCINYRPVSLSRAAKLFLKGLVSLLGQSRLFLLSMSIKPSVQALTDETEAVLYQ